MIIAKPDDGTGNLYHLLNLLGETVHAYRDLHAAHAAREGDQRILIVRPDGSATEVTYDSLGV